MYELKVIQDGQEFTLSIEPGTVGTTVDIVHGVINVLNICGVLGSTW